MFAASLLARGAASSPPAWCAQISSERALRSSTLARSRTM
uniref:Uncharacterized protein n=1 Tax=Arundo donax TaxID=35708 RepID=A0A0A9AWX6_ARUDO